MVPVHSLILLVVARKCQSNHSDSQNIILVLAIPIVFFSFYFYSPITINSYSPRHEYKPTSVPPDAYTELVEACRDANNTALPKIKEELISWRDNSGNSVLHLAAFNGHVRVARCVFDSVKGRKLVQLQNSQGATPLAMAIIAGQVRCFLLDCNMGNTGPCR